ncbi:MAG: tetratricopeptide repeat protein [Luteolibacter sp.]
MKLTRHSAVLTGAALVVGALIVGTWRNPDFWSTADQRGDRLMATRNFKAAAKVYHDPLRKGAALYRDGQFEDAARTFTQVSGAIGAYDAGNAWLMHGKYDDAIRNYEKALKFRPGWKEASDNRALAIARRDWMKASDKYRAQESADAYKPDEIVYDPKGSDKSKSKPDTEGEGQDDQTALQATWLRRVKTTPADFLKAKFAWQAQAPPPSDKP